MNEKMKKIKYISIIMIIAFMLTGCGNKAEKIAEQYCDILIKENYEDMLDIAYLPDSKFLTDKRKDEAKEIFAKKMKENKKTITTCTTTKSKEDDNKIYYKLTINDNDSLNIEVDKKTNKVYIDDLYEERSIESYSSSKVSVDGVELSNPSINDNMATYKFTAPNVTEDKKYTIKFSASGLDSSNNEQLNDTTATATITVTAPIPDPPPAPVDTRSTNANLSDLGINPKEYDFKTFTSPNRTSHTATVPNEIEEVEVWYKQADTKSTVSITAGKGLKVNNGKVSGLQVGKNTITITVTAEAGNTKKYTITVTRKEAGVTVEPPVEEPPVQEPEVPEEPTDNEVTEPGEGIEINYSRNNTKTRI